jgi:NAD(P)-dependent dehydrogenase (short-subunit alcohol dehydrogenase family)
MLNPIVLPSRKQQMSRVALITGAAGALGSTIAEVLAERGWSLVLTGQHSDDVAGLAADLGHRHPEGAFTGLNADLANPSQISSLVTEAAAWHGQLDCLVNNAGRPTRSPLQSISITEWDGAIAVNLRAPMLLMQAFAAEYRAHQTSGAIVNIASRTYATGGPVAYVAAKAGLVGITRSAAFELGPRGIRVNAVAPSMVETPFVAGSRTPAEMDDYRSRQSALSALKRPLAPREIATAVAYLASDDASFVTGEVLHVAGGLQLPPVP